MGFPICVPLEECPNPFASGGHASRQIVLLSSLAYRFYVCILVRVCSIDFVMAGVYLTVRPCNSFGAPERTAAGTWSTSSLPS